MLIISQEEEGMIKGISIEEFEKIIPEIEKTSFEVEGNLLTANVVTKKKDKYILYISGKKTVAYKLNED